MVYNIYMINTNETAEQYAKKMCNLRTKKEMKELVKWAKEEISEYESFIKAVNKYQKNAHN